MSRSEIPQLVYNGQAMPAPRFHTRRDPAWPTRGRRQAAFASIWLNQPFMPWQAYVADVAGEHYPDGRPRRPLVVVTVQRQAGKTHLLFVKKAERAFSIPRYRGWCTAQTGADARDAFLKFDSEHIEGTPLRPFVQTLRGNGHEQMTFANGSTIRPHPPTEKALHGKQSDDNDIDEAWAFDLEDGRALEQAISPTQLTRPLSATWIWSAGGTANSAWLADLVSRGRAGDPDIAFFEWGIPDDLDLDDLDLIARWHPAYGHTVTADSIRKLRVQIPNDAEFARAAGNRWTEAIGGAIASGDWTACRYAGDMPADIPVGFGAARAADGSEAVLAAAGMLPDGRILVEILAVVPAYGAGAELNSWLVHTDRVGCDPSGPSGPLFSELQTAGATVEPVTGRAAAAGVGQLLDAIPHGGILFRPHESLDAAARVAGTRRVADGGRAWAHAAAGASIAALDAATAAIHQLQHQPAPVAKPFVMRAS